MSAMSGIGTIRIAFPAHLLFTFALAALPVAAAWDAPLPGAGSPAAEQPDKRPTGEKGSPQTEGEGEEKPKRTPDLSSQRATVATFLNSIDQAERGQVESYVDALACLDLSGLSNLPEDARVPQGRKVASLLKQFIDRHAIELELIPDHPEGEP